MKFITIFALIFATANADDSLAGILNPVVCLLSPLLGGLGNGLTVAAPSISTGIHSAGRALSDLISGTGSMVAKTASGLGGTVAAVPNCVYNTARDLQCGNGLVRQPLDLLFGRIHHHPRPPPTPYLIHVQYTNP